MKYTAGRLINCVLPFSKQKTLDWFPVPYTATIQSNDKKFYPNKVPIGVLHFRGANNSNTMSQHQKEDMESPIKYLISFPPVLFASYSQYLCCLLSNWYPYLDKTSCYYSVLGHVHLPSQRQIQKLYLLLINFIHELL